MKKHIISALAALTVGGLTYKFGGKNVAKSIVSGSAAFALSEVGIKSYKKHLSESVEEESTNNNDISDDNQKSDNDSTNTSEAATPSPSKISEQDKEEILKTTSEEIFNNLSDTSKPMTGRILNLLAHSTNWSNDLIDGYKDIYYDADGNRVVTMYHDYENYIHLMNKEHRGRKFVEVLICVPPFVKSGSQATPKLRDYVNEITSFLKEFWQKNNLGNNTPNVFVKGYLSKVSKTNCVVMDGQQLPVEEFEVIPQSMTDSFRTNKNGQYLPDGLPKMVAYYDSNPDELKKDGLISATHYVGFEVELIDEFDSGISILNFINLLKTLCFGDFQVCRENGDCAQILGPLVFHPGTNLAVTYSMDLNELISAVK